MISNRKYLLTLLCSFLTVAISAQYESNVWYFGAKAGVDFNSGTAVALSDGQMNTNEGCATLCDSTGQLMFYTDGRLVYNRNHQIMSNGTDLLGHSSSTQSAVAVKKPGSNVVYGVFCVSLSGSNKGLTYSEVDMSLNGGLGNVNSVKNELIHTSLSERITAVKHANNRDYWIIVQSFPGNSYHSYLYTKDGVSSTPVTSSLGFTTTNSTGGFVGYLKSNVQGDQIAVAFHNMGIVELLDFDNSDGSLSNVKRLDNVDLLSYGLEFSLEGRFLYVSSSGEDQFLSQFDLEAGNLAQIKASRVRIHQNVENGGALQLGPDGAIYAARAGTPYLGRIANPDSKGTACNYVDEAINLKGRNCNHGLPTYYNSIIINTDISIANACLGDSSIIELDGTVPDSIEIYFGDNTKFKANGMPSRLAHLYSDAGIYNVRFIYFFPTKIDSTKFKAYVFERPEVDLGSDTTLCEGETLTILLDGGFTYTWEDGSNTINRSIKSEGLYHVEASNQSCTDRDTLLVSIDQKPEIPFQNYYSFCETDSLTLSMGINVDFMLWSTGDTSHASTFYNSGNYWVKAGMHNCYDSLNFQLEVATVPVFDLGPDSNYCEIDSLNLSTGLTGLDHLWSSGSTQDHIWVYTSGLYTVEVQNGPCSASDEVRIDFVESGNFELDDHLICAGDSIQIGVPVGPGSYLWNSGENSSEIYVNASGTYTLQYTNSCDTYIDSSIITTRDCDCYVHLPNAFSPNQDGLNENFPPDFECRFFRYDLVIYNRWGQEMFESTENANNWDGTYKGEIAPNGLYIYHLSYMDQTGLHHVQGQVLIVR